MTTITLAGADVDVDEEGFLTDANQWNERIAAEIAKQNEIETLTDRHWQVITFMRSEFAAKGSGPTVRVLGRSSGVETKELYELFPNGPAKLAAKIAGIPKPRGCI